jgi:hypothetical protein
MSRDSRPFPIPNSKSQVTNPASPTDSYLVTRQTNTSKNIRPIKTQLHENDQNYRNHQKTNLENVSTTSTHQITPQSRIIGGIQPSQPAGPSPHSPIINQKPKLQHSNHPYRNNPLDHSSSRSGKTLSKGLKIADGHPETNQHQKN